MEGLTIIYLAGTFFSFLLVAFIIYYVILHQKKVNDYNLQLKEQELKKQQALLEALTEGQENERQRLAEELHDGIGAKLSGLNMSLEYLYNQGITDIDLLKQVSVGVSETIDEIREISQNLKPSSLFSKGLDKSLAEYVERLNIRGNCNYRLYIENFDEPISQELQFGLFRIVSELLTNIHKHAEATEASVQVLLNNYDVLQLIAEDNGIGFKNEYHTNGKHGIGLQNIENRVAAFNGTINIDSTAQGTTIIIEIPVI
ncbi:MAG: sensor histidine kinase [Bacteroidia bacterium]|nr:sensor histidine kinase [Bacteroidia bacterium]